MPGFFAASLAGGIQSGATSCFVTPLFHTPVSQESGEDWTVFWTAPRGNAARSLRAPHMAHVGRGGGGGLWVNLWAPPTWPMWGGGHVGRSMSTPHMDHMAQARELLARHRHVPDCCIS
eukprot:jgi/Botrbrau1/11697/Bobra.0195s0028.1